MANDRKIELDTPDLLVKYQDLVLEAAEQGIREALRDHKAAGNPVAVSRNGKVTILQPADIPVYTSSLDEIWSGSEDDVYAELLKK